VLVFGCTCSKSNCLVLRHLIVSVLQLGLRVLLVVLVGEVDQIRLHVADVAHILFIGVDLPVANVHRGCQVLEVGRRVRCDDVACVFFSHCASLGRCHIERPV